MPSIFTHPHQNTGQAIMREGRTTTTQPRRLRHFSCKTQLARVMYYHSFSWLWNEELYQAAKSAAVAN